MRVVGIKALKDKLSEYIRAASAGEVILVTDRDKVVAEIKAPSGERQSETESAFLARGVREGWITPATIPPGTPLPPRKPVMKLADLLADLDEARAD
ncbi:MAG: prevent-host-death protein [Parvularculaceae bacterium]